jgi:protein-arginine kinase activator protein McsA
MSAPILCQHCSLRGSSFVATKIAHDRRGCFYVCDYHADWREARSWLAGHGAACHEQQSGRPWQQLTAIPADAS